MYLKIEDFITDWKRESEATIKIFSKIDDKNLNKKVDENVRNLGRLAWHITQTLTEMPFNSGIIARDELDKKPIPKSVSEIIKIYKKQSEKLIKAITENWQDKNLTEEIEVYGQKWEKRKVLAVLIAHQIHHRAQMTVIMRLLNIEVPGIYGPSKEEWTQYGMDVQE